MAGTREGAAKAKAKNLEKDPNFYANIGGKGGRVSSPTKGFGHPDIDQRAMGLLGGKKSRRGKANDTK